MLKNDKKKKLVGENNNNLNDLGSREPTSAQKKVRKDGKGNLILKKDKPFKKTKYHAYLIDNLIPGKEIATIIEVESYKKYNLEGDEEFEEEGEQQEHQKDEKLEESKTMITQRCCFIF